METMRFCSMCHRVAVPGEEITDLGERIYHTACLRAGVPVKFGSGKPVPTLDPEPRATPNPSFADRRGRAEYLRQLKLKGENK